MADDPIDQSMRDIDRNPEGPATYREQRREFQSPGIDRPDSRPLAGQTIMERMKNRVSELMGRPTRDTARSQTRR